MWTQRSIWHAAVAILVCAACRNSNFCPGANPNNNCFEIDAAPQSCRATADCPASLVCDLTDTMTCVECTRDQAGACSGKTPSCGPDHTCQECTAHADCASAACLPDGTCGDDMNVAYVDPSGSNTAACTKMNPCTEVSSALATTRPFVKFQGITNEQVSLNSKDVTFLADPGAKLTDTSNGILLKIDGTSHVAIYDLEIGGASGAGNAGISLQPGNTATVTLTRAKVTGNTGGGITASGGSLTVTQSTLTGNQGGGITVTNGTFVIVGNVFFGNGTQGGTIGGVAISTAQGNTNRLEFNSFNTNQTQTGVGAAIHCLAGTFTARNNIMSNNGTLMNLEQVSGTCLHAYSIVQPGTVPLGMGNKSADPLFANTATGDLHLKAGSPALRGADPSSDLIGPAARDIDGDARTSPADIGADEAP